MPYDVPSAGTSLTHIRELDAPVGFNSSIAVLRCAPGRPPHHLILDGRTSVSGDVMAGSTVKPGEAPILIPWPTGSTSSRSNAGKRPVRRRPRAIVSPDGNSCGLLHQDEGQPVAGAEDARPPGFPSVEELEELNRRIHDDAGSPELVKLDQPSPLRSCLARARAAYAGTPEGVIETAALLVHGIAQAQAFVDGNRRTAFFATQFFLHANGYGYLTSTTDSDNMLARYLNQVVDAPPERRPGPEKFVELFSRRLESRRGPG